MCSFFLYYFLYLPPVILEELRGVRKNILIQSRQDSIILMIYIYIYNGYMIVMYQVNMLWQVNAAGLNHVRELF
jgi:hypothetical protein